MLGAPVFAQPDKAGLRAKITDAIGKAFVFQDKAQKPDGSWASENPRWMEKDPVLVTCYCILALAYISGPA